MKEKVKKIHFWDEDIGDTLCGYLEDDDEVTVCREFVNCIECVSMLA